MFWVSSAMFSLDNKYLLTNSEGLGRYATIWTSQQENSFNGLFGHRVLSIRQFIVQIKNILSQLRMTVLPTMGSLFKRFNLHIKRAYWHCMVCNI
jgi:hypothetical protein